MKNYWWFSQDGDLRFHLQCEYPGANYIIRWNMKRDYDIRAVKNAIKTIADFNAKNLGDLILYEDGEVMQITSGMLDEWRFTGLSNKDFVALRLWEQV